MAGSDDGAVAHERALWALRAYDTIALATTAQAGPHVAGVFFAPLGAQAGRCQRRRGGYDPRPGLRSTMSIPSGASTGMSWHTRNRADDADPALPGKGVDPERPRQIRARANDHPTRTRITTSKCCRHGSGRTRENARGSPAAARHPRRSNS